MVFRNLAKYFFTAVLPLVLWTAPQAVQASTAKTYAVLPFQVNGPEKYKYMGKAVQSMLSTRLNWTGRFEPVSLDGKSAENASPPESAVETAKLLDSVGADYLIWGTLNIIGDSAGVAAVMQGADARKWTAGADTTLNNLIPGLENLARELRAEIFVDPNAGSKAADKAAEKKEAAPEVAPVNPDFVMADTGQASTSQTAINPRFKYENAPDTPGRWRSQTMDFPSISIKVGDVDGDGRNEAVVLGDHALRVYVREGTRLKLLGEYEVGKRRNLLNLNLVDLDRNGIMEIVVSASSTMTKFNTENPRSFVLNFQDGKFTVVEDEISLWLNAVKLPPNFQTMLVGQKVGASQQLFQIGGVSEVTRQGGKLTLGRKIKLPEMSNVYNFVFLPDPEDGYKIIQLDSQNRFKVYSKAMVLQASTEESYCSSGVKMYEPEGVPGLPVRDTGKSNYMASYYYVPIHPLVAVLGNKGRFELLANKDISVAAQMFDRYRSFSQGEIQSLFWDGIGLNLFWKTRRIKGTVVAFDLGDLDNDGKEELIVCLNTYRGALGFADRKTIVLGYDLNLDAVQ